MCWSGVLKVLDSVFYVLDWCVVCTGLVCCMHWTGVLYALDWYVGLVYRKFWTSVFYVLDRCVHKNVGMLYVLDGYVVSVMYLLDCNVALWPL